MSTSKATNPPQSKVATAPDAMEQHSTVGTMLTNPRSSKLQLLDESDSESDAGGASLQQEDFPVNAEFARRFEHNKKREEQHKLEEKYKKYSADRADREADDSSSDETEDDDGVLATEDLDTQISATLQAIRTKDPRVYDKNVAFYQDEEPHGETTEQVKKEKPVYLQDYHRDKILRGDIGASDDEDEVPRTYAQEQNALKRSFLTAIETAKDEDGDEAMEKAGEADDDDDDDDDVFMKRKEPAQAGSDGVHPSRAVAVKASNLDVANADSNPENFLSNFLAARAWVPEEGESRWEAFESDDDEKDNAAEVFEEAYNLRFENPEKSNEVLKSYARDITASRSVRREEKSKRKRTRDAGREQQNEEKTQRREEKARLRKLKLDESEQKLAKIKQAAGATGIELTDGQWLSFLNDAWDNDKWEEEMQMRFGDDYYATKDDLHKSDEDEVEPERTKTSKKRMKKPDWNEDIDIKDLVPDFEDADAKPAITLSDSENQDEDEEDDDEDDDEAPPSKKRKASDHKRARLETQKKVRRERSKMEALVDSKLELTHHTLLDRPASSAARGGHGPFRYREVSPQSFGMTPRDILLAPSDQALNNFAGLKKLASFRDDERKRRDGKSLGKKARLRQWRRDAFGSEFERTGPTYGFERLVEDGVDGGRAEKILAEEENVVGDVGGKRKKKRKKSKGTKSEATVAA